MASTYDGDGNRAFQLNYNPEAECGYGKNVSGEIFMPEHSTNEDGSLTAEGELFGYICSATGRAYDLTEYVNDTNREFTEVLTAYNINTGYDTESYTYAGSQRLSRNNIWNEARDVNCDEMSYYLYDGRGSVTANTWYNGMVTNVYQYDPYGQVTLGSSDHTDFYGYNAESYNPNTGLEYLRARYYNAEEGRFFQEDTYLGNITDPLTLNRYAYVKNSPLNYVDPSGNISIQDIKDFDWSILKELGPEDAEDFLKDPDKAGLLYKYGIKSREIEKKIGYEYNPDPTSAPIIFDADFYEQNSDLTYITNTLAYILGLQDSFAHDYEDQHGKSISEAMSQAAQQMVNELCEIDNALKFAADTMLVNEAAKALGFMYDKEKDIYYTRKDALQRLFGFNDGIDANEYLIMSNLNALTLEFSGTDDREWRLEFWKGQYGLGISTGAEVGFYEYVESSYNDFGKDDMLHYKSADMADWLDMSFGLYNKNSGELIFERSSHDYEDYYETEYGDYVGKDWWLTGFKLAEYTNKDDLYMKITLNFDNEQLETMHDKLIKELNEQQVRWTKETQSQIVIYW